MSNPANNASNQESGPIPIATTAENAVSNPKAEISTAMPKNHNGEKTDKNFEVKNMSNPANNASNQEPGPIPEATDLKLDVLNPKITDSPKSLKELTDQPFSDDEITEASIPSVEIPDFGLSASRSDVPVGTKTAPKRKADAIDTVYCGKCFRLIRDNDFRVSCAECNKQFDSACSRFLTKLQQRKSTETNWYCPRCRMGVPSKDEPKETNPEDEDEETEDDEPIAEIVKGMPLEEVVLRACEYAAAETWHGSDCDEDLKFDVWNKLRGTILKCIQNRPDLKRGFEKAITHALRDTNPTAPGGKTFTAKHFLEKGKFDVSQL